MLSLPAALAVVVWSSAGQTVMLDFYSDQCPPCHAMAPTVAGLEAKGYPIRRVNVQSEPALASQYQVTSIPCFVMLVDGQVVDRVVGSTTAFRLERMLALAKNAAPPGTANQPPQAGGPPLPAGGSMPQSLPMAGNDPFGATPNAMPPAGGAMAGGVMPASFNAPAPNGFSPNNMAAPQGLPAGMMANPAANAAVSSAGDPLLAVSVRLRVEDPNGRSCGSGTIVDSRSGEALILTCGHIFRDSQGQGRIEVDLFGPNGEEKVEGQLIAYDLKSDVGLVGIRAPHPLAAARVAPPGFRVGPGDPVITVGCNNGDLPSVQRTQITAVDRILGPPNYKVAGQPIEGRSGGGLFTQAGLVLGVCNAADPADHDGLYAGLGAVQELLDRQQLSFVYRDAGQGDAAALATAVPAAGLTPPAAMPGAGSALPTSGSLAAAGNWPGALREMSPEAAPNMAADRPSPWAAPGGATLSAEERAAAAEIGRRLSEGAEVVCIVRSRTNPDGPSEVITLQNASPGFVRQVMAGAQPQDGRRLTSLELPPSAPTGSARTAVWPASMSSSAASVPPSASSARSAPIRLEWSAANGN